MMVIVVDFAAVAAVVFCPLFPLGCWLSNGPGLLVGWFVITEIKLDRKVHPCAPVEAKRQQNISQNQLFLYHKIL